MAQDTYHPHYQPTVEMIHLKSNNGVLFAVTKAEIARHSRPLHDMFETGSESFSTPIEVDLDKEDLAVFLMMVRMPDPSPFKLQYFASEIKGLIRLLSFCQTFEMHRFARMILDHLRSKDLIMTVEEFWKALACVALANHLEAFRILLEHLDINQFTHYARSQINSIPVLWRQPLMAGVFGDPTINLVYTPLGVDKILPDALPTATWIPYWIQIFTPHDKVLNRRPGPSAHVASHMVVRPVRATSRLSPGATRYPNSYDSDSDDRDGSDWDEYPYYRDESYENDY